MHNFGSPLPGFFYIVSVPNWYTTRMFTFGESIALTLVALINVIAFACMFVDKQRSRRNVSGDDRVPEGVLFFLATIGGSVGIYAGMFLLRHKTRKWYFQIGIPLLIAQNAAVAYLVATLFNTI